ncbi:MAG: EAL domain-containing protein [Solirubrobacteraceae bacterium]
MRNGAENGARRFGRVRTEAALRGALVDERQLFLQYQPLVSLRSGQIVGAEALARWRHPEWGLVSPLEFIAVAEDSGLIHELGAVVIRRAAHESVAWQDHPGFCAVAINVSTRQLVTPDEVPALICEAIATERLAQGFVTVEITESAQIEHLQTVRGTLNALKNLGVKLSLDDFGTGYSPLSYLRELPLDSVKIDRTLISNILDTPRAADLAAAIIDMGHALDLQVTAEGVETSEQAALLQALGCDIAQGYYFARPLSPERLTALLHDQPDWLPVAVRATTNGRQAEPGHVPTTRRVSGIWMLDDHDLTTYADLAMAAIVGCEPEQMLGRPIGDFLDPASAALEGTTLALHGEEVGGPREVQLRGLDGEGPDGHERWARLLAHPLPRSAGAYAGAVVIVTDVTERRAAEATVIRLAALVESAADAIITLTPTGDIVTWNQAAQRMYGYSSQEAVGRHAPTLLAGDPSARGPMLDAVACGEIAQADSRDVRKGGEPVDVAVTDSPIRNAEGRVVAIARVARDITERKAAELESARLAAIVESSADAIISLNTDGVIETWNSAAEQLYGYSASEAIGQQARALLAGNLGGRGLLVDRGTFDVLRDVEVTDFAKDGRPLEVSVTSSPIRDGDGATTGISLILRDVGARHEAEEAIRRHAAGQEQIADLGRRALHGEPLGVLFDCAVGAAWRVMGSDFGWLVELSSEATDPVLIAEIGWPDQHKGEPITGERRSLSGHAARSLGPVVVDDWEQEHRFGPSRQRLDRGVRCSVAVLVGDPDSPFGVLELQYTDAGAVPADCLSFLGTLANVLGEAIQSRHAQELISRQRSSLAAMAESLRGLVSEKEALIEKIPGVVIVYDVHADGSGESLFVSRQCQTILGVAGADLLGDARRFSQHVHPDDRERLNASIRQPAAARHDPLVVEYRFVRPDGLAVWVRSVSAVVCAEDGSHRVQAVLFDITGAKQAELERERLELDLRLAQKLEAVGQLAAGVAHEINTPVQFIGNSVTFLKRAADKLLALTNAYHELLHDDQPISREERQRRAAAAEEDSDLDYLIERMPPAFERALDGIERVSAIVRAMRQFAHSSTERAPIDVNEGIRTTLIVANSEYKYVADIEQDLGDLPLVMANASDLNQVFLNLIVNASHAIETRVRGTNERGKITVQTRTDDAGVLITVADTGCGIPADIAGRVFDPFFTTKPVGRGTGQGLAIAHTIVVERHHGAISFEPNADGGTTFRVLLPLDESGADGETIATVSTPSVRAGAG